MMRNLLFMFTPMEKARAVTGQKLTAPISLILKRCAAIRRLLRCEVSQLTANARYKPLRKSQQHAAEERQAFLLSQVQLGSLRESVALEESVRRRSRPKVRQSQSLSS